MTLFDLSQEFRRLNGYKTDFDSEMLYLLNQGQARVSQDLRIPRRMDDLTGQTPLVLPTAAWPFGVLSVYDTVQQKQLPIFTLFEAQQLRPGWSEVQADYTDPLFCVVSSDPISGQVYINTSPAQTTARTYKVYYIQQPAPLALPTDVPFNGVSGMELAHYLIPLWAAGQVGNVNAKQEYLSELSLRRADFYEHNSPSPNAFMQTWMGIGTGFGKRMPPR